MRTHASTPAEDQVPAEWRDKILHERLVVGDKVLLASDAPPGRYEKPKGFFVHLQMKDPAEAERIFHALAENGAVQMPFQQTFWAPASACASIDSLYPGWFNVSELRNVV